MKSQKTLSSGKRWVALFVQIRIIELITEHEEKNGEAMSIASLNYKIRDRCPVGGTVTAMKKAGYLEGYSVKLGAFEGPPRKFLTVTEKGRELLKKFNEVYAG